MEFINKVSHSKLPNEIINDLLSNLSIEYDFAVIFTSQLDSSITEEVLAELRKRVHIKCVIGCTCAGVITTQHEIEREAATTLLLAKLPGVRIIPFYLNQLDLESLTTPESWHNYFEIFPNENPKFMILPDPFEFDINQLLIGFNKAYPGAPIFGGLASGAAQAGGNSLIYNDERISDGAVGVVFTGNINVDTIVSQGCRPIGENFIVTKAQENVVYEIAGRPLLKVLEEIVTSLPAQDQKLAQEAIFIGIAADEYNDNLKRGDFIIRGLIGIDPANGAGAIADYVRSGQTIQFHLRDASTATEDLNEMLSTQQKLEHGKKPRGALIFSCNGRGEYLFKQKDHDLKIIQRHVGVVPTSGFFCAGEIGPISGKNFIHAFTDSIALFYPQTDDAALA
jgi:small ligand-binding sensory domain FIST